MTNETNKRWALVNKNTNAVRAYRATRSAARKGKRTTERIYDTFNGVFVR